MYATPPRVSDVMTRKVVALRGAASFKAIVKAMREWHVSALPVLDDAGRVVGVVSEADLLAPQAQQDAGDETAGPHDVSRGSDSSDEYGPHTVYDDLEAPAPGRDRVRHGTRASWTAGAAATAAELMSAPPVTVAPYATLAHAARLMARARVKRLPVVGDDGTLRGIVSRADLLKVYLRDDSEIADEVMREVAEPLFGPRAAALRVEARDGVVTLAGRVDETALVPVAVRLARAVAGVVDVRCRLAGPPHLPDLNPDAADGHRSRTP
ncbi:CBS domain-containing protein [Streptomyces beihaiensis]|uniref:CBS domain-containing protein n=1 Tax=Streptomyces beihaiensis TaxID=2984495 RepID=A0ABT3TZB5_9ACTN|nr:CBS domain-containing protein [Streptomyces beihaiensis]MCX3061722.1 CBS domain-containing protein [Streptomyces beihaiensis]